MLYCLPVAVVGVDIMQSMWVSGTQHKSFLEDQWNETDGKWGWETLLINHGFTDQLNLSVNSLSSDIRKIKN